MTLDQHQGHDGAEIKVMLGQDEAQYGLGQPSWVKIKAISGSLLTNIRPISKLYQVKMKDLLKIILSYY